MVRGSNNGTAQPPSAEDFNERVKRLLDKQVDVKPRSGKDAAKRLLRGAPKSKF